MRGESETNMGMETKEGRRIKRRDGNTEKRKRMTGKKTDMTRKIRGGRWKMTTGKLIFKIKTSTFRTCQQ